MMLNNNTALISTLSAAGVLLLVSQAPANEDSTRMSPAPAAASIQVYKSPTCGCCQKWIEHLQDNGLAVETIEVADVTPIKQANGVPDHLSSCHTATVEGYVIEGHVPASDVIRLLKDKPSIKGIAVPAMPIGSPGMEVPGRPNEPYTVFHFDSEGRIGAFATHGPRQSH